MKKLNNLQLIIFFVSLTVALTLVVVLAWEQVLMKPLYGWFESNYPGPGNADFRWRMAQRIEHFIISVIVDTIVVTLLAWWTARSATSRRAKSGTAPSSSTRTTGWAC
jgi:hypothetical protein